MVHKDAVNVHLENRYAATWQKYSDERIQTCIRGALFLGDTLYQETHAMDHFPNIYPIFDKKRIDDFILFFNQLNGFFAVIIRTDQAVFAAVDRVRSIPLFYGEAQGQLFLSDDADWVRKSVRDEKMNPMARQEFLHTGYVTGPETLFPHVKQLQAGEMLYITEGMDGPKLQTHRYYRFLHTEPDGPADEATLLAELDAVSEKSVQRLIDYANGRQIVVPLSAGYDSRLNVALLKRLRYDNVLTFSYGVPANQEAETSKDVAASLNYDWEFVPYSRRLWRQCWVTEERKEYQLWASNWTSVPHYQDWLAVWHMKQKGKLAEDAVFAPGHSADLLAGSRSKAMPNLYNSSVFVFENMVESIIDYHYTLQPFVGKNLGRRHVFRNKVIEQINHPSTLYANDADGFETWDVTERQAKFIINSVRVYEFWGYDWYLPLWDKEFMRYWQKIPLSLRIGKKFYDKFVSTAYLEECNRLNKIIFAQQSKAPTNEMTKIKRVNFVARVLKLMPLKQKNIMKWMIRTLQSVYDYYSNPLAISGRYKMTDYVRLSCKGLSSAGILANTSMKELKECIEK